MQLISDVVRGALKLDGLPDRLVFNSWRDFVQALPSLLAVELPTSVSGVVVGKDYPSDDDRDKIWFRRDSSGAFLGTYAFQVGSWRLLYQLPPNQIIWVYGTSASIPDGFVLIEVGDSAVPSNVVNAVMSQYVPDGLGGYVYFAIRFAGY